jgi:hypothetical protein
VRQNTNPATIVVYQNNGSGGFTALTPTIFPSNEELVNFVDVNGDGRADLISERSAPLTYFYRLASADGTFGAGVQLSYAHYRYSGDFNGDGKIDFPTVTDFGGNFTLQFYYNAGNGIFAVGGSIPFGTSYPVLTNVADFNNDAKPDLLFYTPGNQNKLTVVLNQGGGNFSKTDLALPYSTLELYPNVKDFNGDGFQDIYVYNGSGGLRYTIYTNNGTGGFTTREYTGRYPGLPVGDLDGDNKADFLRISNFDYQNNAVPIKVFNETQVSIVKNVCDRFGQTRIVDFDGDGSTDPVFWRESDGRWRYEKRQYPYEVITFNWGQSGDIPMPGDYDGDTKTDIAIYRPSNGSWYWVNSSNNSFSGVTFGANGDRPVASDYNGDGKTDVAVYRPSTGAWYIMFSGTNQFYGALFGATEDKAVPADYDGDGKTDIAVFRPSSGVWYILRSSDNGFFGVTWGTSTDTLVPADYDGDGRADITVFRGGTWYIRRSNDLPSAAYLFGNSTDIPQPGDWNFDGIFDAAVFRPNTKVWYTSYYQFIDFQSIAGEVPISTLNKSY